jgi:hypothetical protein
MSKNGKWRRKHADRAREAPQPPRSLPVRIAEPADAPGVMALLHLMHAENGLAPLAETKVRALVEQALSQDFSICGVIGERDNLEASIGLFACSWWYSDALHLEDRWNFVHPEFRVSTHAAALIDFAKSTAARTKHPLLMGITSAGRTPAKVRLYERQLGDAVGALFWQPTAGSA